MPKFHYNKLLYIIKLRFYFSVSYITKAKSDLDLEAEIIFLQSSIQVFLAKCGYFHQSKN